MERAQLHADALRADVDAFRERSPDEFETKSLDNPLGQPDIRVIVQVTEAPPVPGTSQRDLASTARDEPPMHASRLRKVPLVDPPIPLPRKGIQMLHSPFRC